MPATLTVDTAGFRRALLGLQQFTGADLKLIIRAEAGSILKACAGDTKVGTRVSAQQRAVARAFNTIAFRGKASPSFGYLTINSGKRGGEPGLMWYRTKRGKFQLAGTMSIPRGSHRWSNLHFPDVDWSGMVEGAAKAANALRDYVPRALESIGLARQSWVQIADALGLPLENVPGGRLSAAGIAKARRALASDGRAYTNGTAAEYAAGHAFFLEMVNRLPYGAKIQLDATLARNISARARYFEENLARGVFDRLSTIARAYPGLQILRN